MNRNMNVGYLAFVNDKQKFSGLHSVSFLKWLKEKSSEYLKSNTQKKFDYWITENIPLLDEKSLKTDIEMLSAPKVFKVSSIEEWDNIIEKGKLVSMQFSGNAEMLIMCVL